MPLTKYQTSIKRQLKLNSVRKVLFHGMKIVALVGRVFVKVCARVQSLWEPTPHSETSQHKNYRDITKTALLWGKDLELPGTMMTGPCY